MIETETTITGCYTYILKGENDFHYCGITKDIDKRYIQHKQGKSKSTRKNRPYLLKFIRKFDSRKEARNLEVKIKNAGVKKWYMKNIVHGKYPNLIITHLIGNVKG